MKVVAHSFAPLPKGFSPPLSSMGLHVEVYINVKLALPWRFSKAASNNKTNDNSIIAGEAGVVNERVRIMLKKQIMLDPLA